MALELSHLLTSGLDAAFKALDDRIAQRYDRYVQRKKQQESGEAPPGPLTFTGAARMRTVQQVNVISQRASSTTIGIGGTMGPVALEATSGWSSSYSRQENFTLEINWFEAWDNSGRLELVFQPQELPPLIPATPLPPPVVTPPTAPPPVTDGGEGSGGTGANWGGNAGDVGVPGAS